MNRDKSRKGLASCRISVEPVEQGNAESAHKRPLVSVGSGCRKAGVEGSIYLRVELGGDSKSFPQLVSPPPSSSQAFASSLLLYGLQAGLPMSELAFPWPCLTALSPCLPIASARGVYSKKSSREGGYQATLGWKCCLFLGPYLLTPLLPSAQEIHMFPSSPPRGSGLHSL